MPNVELASYVLAHLRCITQHHSRAIRQAALEAPSTLGWRPGAEGDSRSRFVDLAMGLNGLVRSLGLPDAYPFVILPEVGRKLDFVDEAVNRFRSRPL